MIPTHPELRRASRSYAHTATRIQKQKGFLRTDPNPKSTDRGTISFWIRTTVRTEHVEPYYHNAQKLQRYALRHRSGSGTAHRSRFIQTGRKTPAQLVKLREQQALPFLGKGSWSTRPQSDPPSDSPRGKTDPPERNIHTSRDKIRFRNLVAMKGQPRWQTRTSRSMWDVCELAASPNSRSAAGRRTYRGSHPRSD